MNEIKSGSSRVSLYFLGGMAGAANDPVLTEFCKKLLVEYAEPTDTGRDVVGVLVDGKMLCAKKNKIKQFY